MTTLGAPRELTGPPERVRQQLTRLQDAGLVRTFTAPEPHPLGCRVWWWGHQPVSSTSARPRLAPDAGSAWTPRPLTPRQRQALGVGAMLTGAGALLAGVVWLIVRAVSGVWSAATGNPFLAILVVVLAAVGGWKWLTRERIPKTRGGHSAACPGLIQHCNGCRDHG